MTFFQYLCKITQLQVIRQFALGTHISQSKGSLEPRQKYRKQQQHQILTFLRSYLKKLQNQLHIQEIFLKF